MDSSISLKELADNFKQITEVEKVYKVLSSLSDFESGEALKKKHPGKFDFEQMVTFVGAVTDGDVKNMKATLLQNYYNTIVSAAEEEVHNPVEFFSYESVSKVFEEEDIMNKFEMIIYNMKKLNKSICMEIINAILGGDKTFHVALLVFPNELDHFEVLSYLRSQQSSTSLIEFKIIPLLFRIEDMGSCVQVGENIKYALMFGKLTVLKAPLLVCYGDLSQLVKVVESVCPPKSSVALVSDLGVPCIKLHNKDLERKVKYYGAQNDISKFRKKLDSDKTPVNQANPEQSDSEDTPSTSTTPVKSTNVNLDDSGFAEKACSAVVRSFGSETSKTGGFI